MDVSTPLVTIGMPIRNGENTVIAAIESLCAQTEPHFQIRISDNASTDRTASLCAELCRLDHRIFYERLSNNIGSAANFGRLLRSADLDYFMWAACDDLWAPTFLETSLQLLSEAPDAIGAAVGVRIIDDIGTEIGRILPPCSLQSSSALDRGRGATGDGYMAIYGLWRRAALSADAAVGDFAGSATSFVFSMAMKGRIVTTSDILVTYRVLDGSAKRKGPEAHLYDDARVMTKMYQCMTREIGSSGLHRSEKMLLRLHVTSQWLASIRWNNERAFYRAWEMHRYGDMARRLPTRLVLGPSRAAYRLASGLWFKAFVGRVHRLLNAALTQFERPRGRVTKRGSRP